MRKSFVSAVTKRSSPLNTAEFHTVKRAIARTRERMGKFFTKNQILGRKGSIGCVSLEISQRCNLDCSLCYLSSSSNQVTDLPLQEIFRRLDEIRTHFGVGTNVQISGGDPTLRDRRELMEIVRYARELGLHPAMFTNGILCDREMLEELVENGLSDVAFHVDLTQDRKGFNTEKELNRIRLRYIDLVRGLPLMVVFNTTVHENNFLEIPDLVRFFTENADVVGFASFQLQADTGRGVLGKREELISLGSVKRKIDEGAGDPLGWDGIRVGHPKCHSYVPALAVNGKAFGLIDDPDLAGDFLNDFQHITHDRRESPVTIALRYIAEAVKQPLWLIRGLKYYLPRLWKMRRDLVASRGKAHKISFFVQNFMDAEHLDPERIKACSFMVMTPDGPLSMCAHNAKRDDYILRPISVPSEQGTEMFYPLQNKKPVLVDDNAVPA
jgi:organic radical activating enzyme